MAVAGSIELILGPMFAGKTTELLRRITRFELAKKTCVVMKYSKDTRYSSESVSTHDLQMRSAISCSLLMSHIQECMKFDVIGVDEGQFFADIVEFSDYLANHGKIVIIAGLDGDFQRKPFGHILELIPKCESLTKISAVCTETGKDATFTQRTVESTELELIGGADLYRAASRASYFHQDPRKTGDIHLIIGPVLSGKTTELLRVLNRHHLAGRKTLLIHQNNPQLKKVPSYKQMICSTLPKFEEISEFDAIGVDNAEKFDGIANWADSLANQGKRVYVAAIQGNTNGEMYPEIMQLFSYSEYADKLASVCPITGLSASFNLLTQNTQVIPISRLALLRYKEYFLNNKE